MPAFSRSLAAALALACFGSLGRPLPASAQTNRLAHEFFEYVASPRDAEDELALPEPGLVNEDATGAAGGGWGAPVVYTPEGEVAPPEWADAATGGQRNAPESSDAPARLDRDTEEEGRLAYAAVYTPSVAPFKRNGARDRVIEDGSSYAIVVADPRLERLTEVPRAQAGSELFVGRLSVAADANEAIPVPSVAPHMQLHALRVAPQSDASLWRDGAGNHFVQIARGGTFDVELEVSAPAAYFGGALPAPAPRGAPLGPSRLQRDARVVLDGIGVEPSMSDVEAVERLLTWFRSFEARPFPEVMRTDNAYLDIAVGRIGVCRHRSQAFVMTAAAAGIRARYLYNDAHAFVEVEFANGGWRRFDLGGASEGLDVFGGDAREQHEAPSDPTMPRSAAADDYSNTVNDASFVDGSESAPPASGPMQLGAASSNSFAPAEAEDITTLGALFDAPGSPQPSSSPASGTEDASAPQARSDEGEDTAIPLAEVNFADETLRRATSLTLDPLPERVYRGQPIPLRGQLHDDSGAPVGEREIEVYLGPRDRDALDAAVQRIGNVRLDAAGRFDAEVRLPSLVPLGEWGLYVVFPGDESLLPAHPPD